MVVMDSEVNDMPTGFKVLCWKLRFVWIGFSSGGRVFSNCGTDHCSIQRLRITRDLGQDVVWDVHHGITCQLGPLKQHECAEAVKLLCVTVPEWTGDEKSARQWRGSSFVSQVALLWLWCIHEVFSPTFSFGFPRKVQAFPPSPLPWSIKEDKSNGFSRVGGCSRVVE